MNLSTVRQVMLLSFSSPNALFILRVDRYLDMFERVATEAVQMIQRDKKVTLSKESVTTACVLSPITPRLGNALT
jgi:hypothetical protein